MEAGRPGQGEFHPFYAAYVDRLADGPILPRLAHQVPELDHLLTGLRADGASYRYRPEKWSVKQVVGHLADAERIFGMRATCFARGDTAPLPGFEQDDYVAEGGFDARTIDSLRHEFEQLRGANVEMFGGLAAEAWHRSGTASGWPVTVRALAWIMVGHVDHHLEVLRDRYRDAFAG